MINSISIFLFIWSFSCRSNPSEMANSQKEMEGNVYPHLERLDTIITEEMVAARVPGLSACIIKSDEIFWCNGYGFADVDSERMVSHTTPFMLASISKTFVAVAAMHLQENSGFSIDTPINSILDFHVEHPEDDTEITTKMLLSHTSGITDNWSVLNAVVVDGDSPITLGDFLQSYLVVGGEQYNSRHNFTNDGVTESSVYSNIGVALAAYVVEVSSGISFDTYCNQHIFEPLQMENTAWHLADLDENLLAIPYEWSLGNWNAYQHYGYPDYPDGSLRTGAEQLATFLSMFHNNGSFKGVEIVSMASVEEMNTIYYPNLDSTQGLVWYRFDVNDETYTGHNGGDYGVLTEMGVREDGLGFVILMNSDGDYNILPNIEEAMIAVALEQ